MPTTSSTVARASYFSSAALVAGIGLQAVNGWWLLPAAAFGAAGYAVSHKDEPEFQGMLVDWSMYVPVLRDIVAREVRKEIAAKLIADTDEIQRGFHEKNKKTPILTLPEEGMSSFDILENLLQRSLTDQEKEIFNALVKGYTEENPVTRLQKMGVKAASGALYPGNDPELFALMAFINQKFPYANATQTTFWPEAQACEAELVTMVSQLFKGDQRGVKGFMTPGGTGSILESMLAYKRLAARTYYIAKPNVVLPSTRHAAFDKLTALGIDVRVAQCDPITRMVIPGVVEGLIDSNTICVVGSAPNFPVGSVDDFAALSAIVLRMSNRYHHQIGLHADCCLGGNHIAFSDVERYKNINFETCDALTSMSYDTHKTGYAPKESSIVLLVTDLNHARRNSHTGPLPLQEMLAKLDMNLWAHSIYERLKFEGGSYLTQGATRGSRTGVTALQAWASYLHHGKKGYRDIVTAHREQLKLMRDGLSAHSHLELVGTADVCVIAVRAKDPKKLDIHRIGDAMQAEGWKLHFTQDPNAIHFCLTNAALSMQPEFAKNYLAVLEQSVAKYLKDPGSIPLGESALYGALSTKIPPGLFIGQATRDAFAAIYVDGFSPVAAP